MNGKRSRRNSIGQITSGVSHNTFVLETINFVYQQLPYWRDDPNRTIEQSERKLNPDLSKFLNARAKNVFPMIIFHHEEPQFETRLIDLSALPSDPMQIEGKLYNIRDPVIVFECKRLPAPSTAREKEYVTGLERRNGGIQRFKLGLHGAEHAIAVMVGYIQEDSPYDWFDRINHWISELAGGYFVDLCVWDTSETLRLFEENVREGVASCQSVHYRTGSNKGERITLRHLWIIMNIQ